jgi:hypothetical protein
MMTLFGAMQAVVCEAARVEGETMCPSLPCPVGERVCATDRLERVVRLFLLVAICAPLT